LAFLKSAADRYGFVVKPIIYFREQVEWFLSAYAHWVRVGRTDDHPSCYFRRANLNYADYAGICERLVAAFGRQVLSVRIYDRRELAGGDIRRDILRVTETDCAGCNFAAAEANASISTVQIEVIRSAQMNKTSAKRFARETSPLLRQMDVAAPELYRLLAPAQIAEMRRHYRDGNEWVRKTFFPDRPGPLFRSKIPDAFEPADPTLLAALAEKLLNALEQQRGEQAAAAKRERRRRRVHVAKAEARRERKRGRRHARKMAHRLLNAEAAMRAKLERRDRRKAERGRVAAERRRVAKAELIAVRAREAEARRQQRRRNRGEQRKAEELF
jgi:hypothetical protein